MVRRTLLAGAALAALAAPASAQIPTNATADTLEACRPALVAATYDSGRERLNDWRMADHVDERSYDALKTAFGPDAAIYGVPAGLDWAAFQDSLAQLRQEGEVPFTSREFLNVAWTGLDGLPDGPYQACLADAAHIGESGGIALAPSAATDADVSVTVRYVPGPEGPAVLPVEWVGVLESAHPPPPALEAGDQTVILPRPPRERTVSVVGGGFTATIVLTPLPEVRHQEPSSCRITATPAPLPRLRPFDVATWVCPDIMPAGTYRVSAEIAPATEPQDAAYRVAYKLALLVPAGGTTFAVDLPLADGGLADLNVEGGAAPVFRGGDIDVSIPRGVVSFALQVTGIADLADLEDGTADDAAVLLPAEVTLSLERVSE